MPLFSQTAALIVTIKIASCPLSYFPHSYCRKFGNEFLVVATHGALDGFVCLQTLQGLLCCAIVGIAECLGKYFRTEFVWQQAETILELIRATTLLLRHRAAGCRNKHDEVRNTNNAACDTVCHRLNLPVPCR